MEGFNDLALFCRIDLFGVEGVYISNIIKLVITKNMIYILFIASKEDYLVTMLCVVMPLRPLRGHFRTTLSLDETKDIIAALRSKFPNIKGPAAQDICYATENRQVAVKQVASEADLLLVVGSENSSNSNRLVEVARNLGTNAHLIDSCNDIEAEWLKGVKTIALTAGASAPECLVEEVVKFLGTRGFGNVQEVEVMPENVRFGLPPEIVEAIAAAPANVAAE